MRISANQSAGFETIARKRAEPASARDKAARNEAQDAGSAVALVLPLQSGRSSSGASYLRLQPDCGVIAQLLATRADLPQTRARRRETPQVACARYETTANIASHNRLRPALVLKLDC